MAAPRQELDAGSRIHVLSPSLKPRRSHVASSSAEIANSPIVAVVGVRQPEGSGKPLSEQAALSDIICITTRITGGAPLMPEM